jgi:hypothetical protein
VRSDSESDWWSAAVAMESTGRSSMSIFLLQDCCAEHQPRD